MECTCVCDYGWDDGPDCYEQRMVKARKQHRCGECARTIEPGETYEVFNGIWDGTPARYKTCLGCQRMRNEYCCSWTFGEVAEAIWECLGTSIIDGSTWDDDEEADDE